MDAEHSGLWVETTKALRRELAWQDGWRNVNSIKGQDRASRWGRGSLQKSCKF